MELTPKECQVAAGLEAGGQPLHAGRLIFRHSAPNTEPVRSTECMECPSGGRQEMHKQTIPYIFWAIGLGCGLGG